MPASSNADPKLEFALARGGCTFGRSLLVREFEGLEEGSSSFTLLSGVVGGGCSSGDLCVENIKLGCPEALGKLAVKPLGAS